MAILFNGGIYLWQGHDAAITFLTAYLVEKSLIIDNLFVFVLIFNYSATHNSPIWYSSGLSTTERRHPFLLLTVMI